MGKKWFGGSEATIKELALSLGLDFWDQDPEPPDSEHRAFLAWPPDVFAVTASMLEQSGAYRRVVSPHGDDPNLLSDRGEWIKSIVTAGKRWSTALGDLPGPDRWLDDPFPSWEFPRWSLASSNDEKVERRVFGLWKLILKAGDTPLHKLEYEDEAWPWVLRLCCIADAACEGIGRCDPRLAPTPVALAGLIWLNQQMDKAQQEYHQFRSMYENDDECHGKDWLSEYDQRSMPATLCKRIHPSRVVVLPKLRTPQRGIVLRSISLHLALVGGADVLPQWTIAPRVYRDRVAQPSISAEEGVPAREQDDSRAHNLLIVPHPANIHPIQFQPAISVVGAGGNVSRLEDRFADRHRLFLYKPADARGIRAHIDQLISRAEDLVGSIRGVVLPEAAISELQFQEVFQGWKPNIDFLICGIVRPPRKNRLARNYAIVRFFGEEPVECQQPKHHRWALDREQIRTYGLGGQLSPNQLWWEGIHVPRRRLHVFSLTPNCYFSALICEDLARPDPIGEVLRAIGPNLIIALLQDGPQLKERWAGRFTVPLADDPGSAVLSVTSLGMSRLSRPGHTRKDRTNTTIALFREPNGSVKEIALPRGADGIVITVTESDTSELSADGRKDTTSGGALALGGVLPINTNNACFHE
ncbi:MAG: hypothetical protein R3B57_05940 [Phycisphaerales bacterium]